MKNVTYIEGVDVFSWTIDNENIMFTTHLMTSEGETIIDIPLHEDFLDLVLAYQEAYKNHINKKLNNQL
jgi:aminopeptidase-like protein